MIILVCTFFLFSIQIFSQSYLNILFNQGNYKNAPIIELKKITITPASDQIQFYLTNGLIETENINEIDRMSFSNTPEGDPLPVELSSFSANVNGSLIVLKWSTKTEVNNYGFEIESSVIFNDVGNLNWKKIGFVQGYGNSNSPKEYSFIDKPQEGNKISYRLKQIDTDGSFQYSAVLSVEIVIPVKFELMQNYPNPFNPSTSIRFNLPEDCFVTLKVYDVIGREVASLINEDKKAGSYIVTFDSKVTGGELASGVYISKIVVGEFTSSIKMSLIK